MEEEKIDLQTNQANQVQENSNQQEKQVQINQELDDDIFQVVNQMQNNTFQNGYETGLKEYEQTENHKQFDYQSVYIEGFNIGQIIGQEIGQYVGFIDMVKQSKQFLPFYQKHKVQIEKRINSMEEIILKINFNEQQLDQINESILLLRSKFSALISSLGMKRLDLNSGEIIQIDQEEQIENLCNDYETLDNDFFNDIWQDYWQGVSQYQQQFQDACLYGEYEKIQELLQYYGDFIDINYSQKDNWSGLHYAISEGHIQIVKILIQQPQIQINSQSGFGRTPLHIAIVRESVEIVELLIQNKNIDINIQDKEFNTPMHLAAMQGNEIIVFKLIQAFQQNIDFELRNFQNMTCYECSESYACLVIFQEYYLTTQLNNQKNQQYVRTVINGNILRNGRSDHHQLGPQDFFIEKVLGNGGFGKVYLVHKIGENEDQKYAMKILDKEKFFSRNLIKYAKTERNVLRIMKHPFIIQLKFAFQTQNSLYMIMDYAPGGDLHNLLQDYGPMDEDTVKIYLCEIILAIEALHRAEIIFRDLKPSNIVLDKDGHCLLTDFGLSKDGLKQKTKTGSFCGSLAYLAPEMVDKKGHDQSIDWYLLGILTYELLTGTTPFLDKNRKKMLKKIKNQKYKMPNNISNELKSLIQQLIHQDPEKRLGSKNDGEEVRMHKFFDGINWNDVYNRKLIPIKPMMKNKVELYESPTRNMKITFSDQNMTRKDRNKQYVDEWSYIDNNIQLKNNLISKKKKDQISNLY
ncbi:Protein kinase-like domain [Pseudocohnilembus persalinus]|uniref:Protein kinase-like domain n=1 Tax=Pseudocohnilembus persalinus TaxID=266149 RepID=A0A0V0R418_PSEPJ|nr:Protein kinase-like domain [Pseudocohnilembus persalinus]|eukprot:KRX09229.1 Protein kinase-like domain [Pseudocohnilembus persalinus]